MSLHMVYRQGAFDWFDTVFCSGPHHINELRCLEEKYKLPQKKLLKHGYSRLDSLIKYKQPIKTNNDFKHALFAPSWGPNAAIELGLGEQVVEKLLSFGCKVTFRPHPETLKSSLKIVNKIVRKHSSNTMFAYDESVSSLETVVVLIKVFIPPAAAVFINPDDLPILSVIIPVIKYSYNV